MARQNRLSREIFSFNEDPVFIWLGLSRVISRYFCRGTDFNFYLNYDYLYYHIREVDNFNVDIRQLVPNVCLNVLHTSNYNLDCFTAAE